MANRGRGAAGGRGRALLGVAAFAGAVGGAGAEGRTREAVSTAPEVPEVPEVVVRVFEVRRVSADFSPLEGLEFALDTDGRGAPMSSWLATLARRIPDAYFSQLLTLRPDAGAAAEAREAVLRRGSRAVRVRVGIGGGTGDREGVGAGPEEPSAEEVDPKLDPGLDAELDLELALELASEGGGTEPGPTMRRSFALPPGRTTVVSGRDFEISPTDYLHWFREPRNLDERGRLYRRFRSRTIFLAVAVSRPETDGAAAEPLPPLRLRPPEDPRLRELESPLVGAAAGTLRLAVRLDAEGAPHDPEILENTFPEVAPRVLGIVAGWRFPRAAGRQGRLHLRLESRDPRSSTGIAPAEGMAKEAAAATASAMAGQRR